MPFGYFSYLFPGGSLLFSQVFFTAAVTHQVPGAASDSAVTAVSSPASAEMANAVVALASSVAATSCQVEKRK